MPFLVVIQSAKLVKKILIAGIGNIFFGDDAFGCEVVKVLQNRQLPKNVKIIDFGIKTRDLAFELCGNYDLVILIDAVKMNRTNDLVDLIELTPNDFVNDFQPNSHEFKLDETLLFAKNLGANLPKIFLIGYEAQNFEFNSEKSPDFNQAVKEAVEKIEKFLEKL